MDESEVTKTQKSYHDIGICVVVVEDKVTDLLRKIVANELSKTASAKWLDLLPKIRDGHYKKYDSFLVLECLANQGENSQQLSWATEEELFKGFRKMISSYQMEFTGDARSVDDILKYLKDNSPAYLNLIKVLIEKFTRDIQAKATALNNFLGENIDEWMQLKEKCFHTKGDDATERLDGCINYCKYRYKMCDDSKGRWDWVNNMNYIRNGVVHRRFKFDHQYQEWELRDNYTKFIDAVSFQDLFPLDGEDMKTEYTEFMRVHDVVKEEVDTWSKDYGAWMIEYYELKRQKDEEIRCLMDEITEITAWQQQANVKRRSAKKRDGWF